jgi:drug/metabolite transporter, DME family
MSALLRTDRSYLKGCALVVLAGLILSLGVFCIRGTGSADAWQYLFWRAIGFTAALAVISAVRQGISPVTQVRQLGGFAWASAATMALSQATFISAAKLTTFAEVFLICALAPLIAAAMARPLLGERIGRLGLIAIVIALTGVTLMSGGSFAGGSWSGRILAIVSAISFAAYTLATRGSRAEDLDGALIVVGLLVMAAGFCAVIVTGQPLVTGWRGVLLPTLHGVVILSLGLILFGAGSRTIPGVTFTLLAQAEAVFAPLWGYLFYDETVTASLLIGGALVLFAVVLQAIGGAREARMARTAPAA